jgi:two-component system sensor histidine kinase PhoQ
MGLAAALVLTLALGLVGLTLAAAYERSAIAGLQERMESWAFLVLAAAELDESGRIQVSEDLGDPRLSQPGSGIYALLQGADQYWSSPSSLGMAVPELAAQAPGQVYFASSETDLEAYVYQLGLAWQLDNGEVLPLTVSVVVAGDEIKSQTAAFRRGLWSALGAAGLILLLAQLSLVWLAFRPLQQVAGDVARVEAGLSESLANDYPAELEPLVRNLNKLLKTEKANQKRYRNALDSLAHSLKTPLAVIHAGLDDQSADSVDAMRRASDEMKHLVTTRLQRAAGSTRRTMVQPIDVTVEVERIIRSLEKVHSRKMIKTSVNIPTGLVFYGEKRDLLEILGNLLDNAFKYGNQQVRLEAGELKGTGIQPGLWLSVEDDGPGIEKQKWPILLQRGVRGDERVEGHGLGLAIVLELMSAYGGHIDISKSELGGARIDLSIPHS